MFADLFQLKTRRAPGGIDRAFVQEVHVKRPHPRNVKVEKMILVCWSLIAVKHVGVIWAVHHYPVPFNALWVNFPTFCLGLLATIAYYWRE
jgi:hypothetical protein